MSTYLGIDIGGSGIKGAPVDTHSGTLSAERLRIETPQPATPDAVAATVAEIARSFEWSDPIGATFPAIVQQGIVRSAANVDQSWIGADADRIFGDATGSAVTVLNDADAAGIAEITFGAGRDVAGVVVLLTFGTGIGSALFVDGRLVPNTELGHLEVDGHDAESRAAASVRDDHDLSWKQWAERVGRYLQVVEALFSPDLVIVGGGVSRKHDKFLPLIDLATPVVPAQLQNQAGIVGAAMAVAADTSRPAH